MSRFKKNVTSTYKEKGEEWLNDLNLITQTLAKKWQLSDLKPVENLSFNYVLKGFQRNKPIVLKFGLDKALEKEAYVLEAYNGNGSIKLYDYDIEHNALLLEQAIPGDSLLRYSEINNPYAIKITSKVSSKIHAAPVPKTHSFPNLEEWLMPLEKDWNMPQEYLIKARKLANHLLKTTAKQVLLHGDLHHDNIIQNNEDYVAIDPKGVIGDPASEAWAIVRNPKIDFPLLAEYTGYEYSRIRDWSYVRGVLSICWCLEDDLDASIFLKFVKSIEIA
jgi:streptomycin 6-kinase